MRHLSAKQVDVGANPTQVSNAQVAELADAPASNTGTFGCEGSTPSLSTK